MRRRRIEKVDFQLTSGDPESDSNSLEVLDDHGIPFLEICCTKEGDHDLVIYSTSEQLSLSVRSIIQAIRIAEQDVRNFPIPPVDEKGNFIL
jgi:hypothetical protein